ncbi:MAG TPA: PTS IIBC subunit, partial [Kandleria vitulina]|nr:PTS IIBC subunit [Kandleria vitulina]
MKSLYKRRISFMSKKTIVSPIKGKVIPIEEIPDPVFSQKMMGNGCGIIPDDGKIYSPVDGEVTMIAPTKHAVGLKTKDGLEILIHYGLETVDLKGEGFNFHVKEGDQVTKGTLLYEADYDRFVKEDINIVTPVIITSPLEKEKLKINAGHHDVNEEIMTISSKKGPHINFDFLQKLGKVLMTVIAVMPAAGLMISLGKLVQMAGADLSLVMTIGTTMENIGWAIINNLHILFACAIGGSWAKERAGGAFAALIAFILINRITGSIFGVTADMVSASNAMTHTLFG